MQCAFSQQASLWSYYAFLHKYLLFFPQQLGESLLIAGSEVEICPVWKGKYDLRVYQMLNSAIFQGGKNKDIKVHSVNNKIHYNRQLVTVH